MCIKLGEPANLALISVDKLFSTDWLFSWAREWYTRENQYANQSTSIKYLLCASEYKFSFFINIHYFT